MKFVLVLLLSIQAAGAETLSLPELNLNLQNVNVSEKSEIPTNFRSVSEDQQVALIGRGVRDELTGETLSLMCVDGHENRCQHVQAASLIKNTLFVFGPKIDLDHPEDALPAALFDKNGWNWSSTPKKISTENLYQLKKKLARRSLKDFEMHGLGSIWPEDIYWYSVGKRGCLADVQLNFRSVALSSLLFDVQLQAAEIFAQKYQCTDAGSVLKVSIDMRAPSDQKTELRVHEAQFFALYPYTWEVGIQVLNGEKKEVFKRNSRTKIMKKVKEVYDNESQAHQLLFQLVDQP